MATSDSTNATLRPLSVVTGDMGVLQNTLSILNDLTNEQAANWSTHDDETTVYTMVERVITLTSAMRAHLKEFEQLVSEAHEHGRIANGATVCHA